MTYTKEDLKEIKDNQLLNDGERRLLNALFNTNNINERAIYTADEIISARSQECHTQKMV